MKVYRDSGTVVALAGGLVLLTGLALVIATSTGNFSGWGVWVAAGLAIPPGLVVLIRVRHTTTTVDGAGRVLTIETRGLVGGAIAETIPFDAICPVVARRIKLDDEYPEHALMLVLNDGSRKTLVIDMGAERVDAHTRRDRSVNRARARLREPSSRRWSANRMDCRCMVSLSASTDSEWEGAFR